MVENANQTKNGIIINVDVSAKKHFICEKILYLEFCYV